MHFCPQLRRVLSAVVLSLFLAALVSSECVACGIGVSATLQAGGCCEHDGQCKASPRKIPLRCVKTHSGDVALIEQPVLVHPVLPPVGPSLLARTEAVRHSEILSVPAEDYSPPDLIILHSALLI